MPLASFGKSLAINRVGSGQNTIRDDRGDGHASCSQTNMEGKSFLAARSPDSPLCCCQLRKDQTISIQNSIRAVDAEAAELDATRAVYDMLKPLGCEAQTRGSRPCLLPSSSGSAETRSAKHFDHQLTFFARPTTSWRSANELTPRCYLAPAKRES